MELLNCGDHSCRFARDKSGMRTNGGCRCLKALDESLRQRIHATFHVLEQEVERLKDQGKTACDLFGDLKRAVAAAREKEIQYNEVIQAAEDLLYPKRTDSGEPYMRLKSLVDDHRAMTGGRSRDVKKEIAEFDAKYFPGAKCDVCGDRASIVVVEDGSQKTVPCPKCVEGRIDGPGQLR